MVSVPLPKLFWVSISGFTSIGSYMRIKTTLQSSKDLLFWEAVKMKNINLTCCVLLGFGFLCTFTVCTYTCGRFPPLVGFKVDRYLGRWWQFEKTFNYGEMLTGRCYSVEYSRDTVSRNKLKMRTDYVTRMSKSANTMFATVSMVSPQFDPSHFRYAMGAMPWMKRNYRVIATDYENFSVEYMCNTNILGNAVESVWILTRERHPSEAVRIQVNRIIQMLELDKLKLYDADQSCEPIQLESKKKNLLEWLLITSA